MQAENKQRQSREPLIKSALSHRREMWYNIIIEGKAVPKVKHVRILSSTAARRK